MNRLHTRLLVTVAITNLTVTVAGCGGSRQAPAVGPTPVVEPAGSVGPKPPPGSTYTISGVITEYRGGPVGGVTVYATTSNGKAQTITTTNQQGSYTLASPSVEPVLLSTWKTGYEKSYKIDVSALSSPQNFIIDAELPPPIGSGGAVGATISGDEILTGDDVYFGGLCHDTPCRLINLGNFHGRTVEVRLRWSDPSRRLALYVSTLPDWEYGSPPPPTLPDRYCCTSDLVFTGTLNGNNTFAVAFEQAAGRRPGPVDAQPFELSVRRKN